jgi:glycerol transport system permease protein
MRARSLVPAVYIVFLLLPIYWLLNMSFKTTNEILGGLTLWPHNFTLDNYKIIFTDPTWYNGYIASIEYVVINTVLSVAVALPAAYAFSRYRFLGDKHLFFWLLTNRMAPPAVFALPFYQLYSAVGLFDTPWAVALSHTLFNIPLAVWILEGFMSGVPKELDETAYVDGYSFWRFFFRIFMPTIAAGIGVACFFCFMFSWVELLLAKTLTAVAAKPIASSISSATTSRRVLPSGAFEEGEGDGRHIDLCVDGLDMADCGILHLHLPVSCRHVGVGVLRAGRRAAPWHPRPRYDPRRPAVHFPVGQRLHLPGLARLHGRAPVGRPCRLGPLCRCGIPLGLKRRIP